MNRFQISNWGLCINVGCMLKFTMLFCEYLKECCHSQMLSVNRFQMSNCEYFLQSDLRLESGGSVEMLNVC